jgi:hypothetical protein
MSFYKKNIMSLNSTLIENTVPTLLTGEYRIMERKGIKCLIESSTNSLNDEGVLFLTTKRLVFISISCRDLISFETEINKVQNCIYSKKGKNRVLEGVTSNENINKTNYRFYFKYDETGFRSLVSLFFSLFYEKNDRISHSSGLDRGK